MATARFVAAISILSFVSAFGPVPPYAHYECAPTTTITTVYETVTVPYESTPEAKSPILADPSLSESSRNTPPASLSYPGVTFPTYSAEDPNPNGPYYNPNDYIPLSIVWPGKPSDKTAQVPPRPTPTMTAGGTNSSFYNAPAWIPKGSDLNPALPHQDTNGKSPWGMLDCPRLPPYLAPTQCSGNVESSLSSLTDEPSKASFNEVSSKPSASMHFNHSGTFETYYTLPKDPSHTSSLKATLSFNASHFPFRPTGFPTGASSSEVPSSSSSVAPVHDSASSCVNPYNHPEALCGSMPNTGVTRKYTFDVGYTQIAPDGVQRNGLVVNGQFPGPLIEANWGDMIEVTVTNSLENEGTSLHWHGLLQRETPWFDGVPSVSQAPIAPGETQVYTFRADSVGTSWYHSHYSSQYAAGAAGPMVIYGPTTADYDEDIGPVMLSDWYHKDYVTLVNTTLHGGIPFSDNVLINGKMNYPCQETTLACTPNAGVSKFAFKSGKKYRLRLINTSAESLQKFTIDGHHFTVIANDFIPINPYTTSVITLGVGQRSDVIVEAVGTPDGAYWMRSNGGTLRKGCSASSGVSPEGLAAIYYEDADTTSVPTTISGLTDAQLTNCGNDDLHLTTPFCVTDLSNVVPATTQTVDITFGNNGTAFVWAMNGESFRGDYNAPILPRVNAGNKEFEPEWNVFDFGTNASIRLIVRNEVVQGAHPMHLHGHNFHVLAEGFGEWDGVVVNPQNPQVRDVQLLRNARLHESSYIVIEWANDNPGVWPFHCHIAWHVSAGLYINVLERPADIETMLLPPSIAETQLTWDAWTVRNIVDQIDSGL